MHESPVTQSYFICQVQEGKNCGNSKPPTPVTYTRQRGQEEKGHLPETIATFYCKRSNSHSQLSWVGWLGLPPPPGEPWFLGSSSSLLPIIGRKDASAWNCLPSKSTKESHVYVVLRLKKELHRKWKLGEEVWLSSSLRHHLAWARRSKQQRTHHSANQVLWPAKRTQGAGRRFPGFPYILYNSSALLKVVLFTQRSRKHSPGLALLLPFKLTPNSASKL